MSKRQSRDILKELNFRAVIFSFSFYSICYLNIPDDASKACMHVVSTVILLYGLCVPTDSSSIVW